MQRTHSFVPLGECGPFGLPSLLCGYVKPFGHELSSCCPVLPPWVVVFELTLLAEMCLAAVRSGVAYPVALLVPFGEPP